MISSNIDPSKTYGQIMLKATIPARSLKLSRDDSVQYFDGYPHLLTVSNMSFMCWTKQTVINNNNVVSFWIFWCQKFVAKGIFKWTQSK